MFFYDEPLHKSCYQLLETNICKSHKFYLSSLTLQMISSAEACLGINQISDLPKAERKILDLETASRYPK